MGNVRGMYGECTGNVRGMYGDRMTRPMPIYHFESHDFLSVRQLWGSSRLLVIVGCELRVLEMRYQNLMSVSQHRRAVLASTLVTSEGDVGSCVRFVLPHATRRVGVLSHAPTASERRPFGHGSSPLAVPSARRWLACRSELRSPLA